MVNLPDQDAFPADKICKLNVLGEILGLGSLPYRLVKNSGGLK